MDNLTHGLTGIGIAYVTQELVNTPQPGLVAAAFIASQLPDLDVIFGSRGKTAYIKHHRGFSHSLLLAPFLALLVSLGVTAFFPQASFGVLYLVCILSLGLHLIFDLLNAYGTKLLWPLSHKRYAWDILMIIDPLVIVLFTLGLTLYIFLGEKGLLFASYPFLGLYILTMFNFKLKAKRYLKKFFKDNTQVVLLPPILGRRKWNFIVTEKQNNFLGVIDAYTGKMEIKEKLLAEKECSLIKATKKDPDVQTFLDFARFPWSSKEEIGDELVIKWSDLRYRLRGKEHFCLRIRPKVK